MYYITKHTLSRLGLQALDEGAMRRLTEVGWWVVLAKVPPCCLYRYIFMTWLHDWWWSSMSLILISYAMILYWECRWLYTMVYYEACFSNIFRNCLKHHIWIAVTAGGTTKSCRVDWWACETARCRLDAANWQLLGVNLTPVEQPGLPLLFDASSWNWGAKSFGLCCARTWQVGNMGKTISAICWKSRWELSIVSLTPCHCSLVSYPAKLDFKVFHEGATILKLFIDCSTKWQERDHVSGRSAGSAAVREVGDIGTRWDERLSGLSAASM